MAKSFYAIVSRKSPLVGITRMDAQRWFIQTLQ
jgi:hypothetical protein